MTATVTGSTMPQTTGALARVAQLNWPEVTGNLDEHGNAVLAGVLSPEKCRALADLYPKDEVFRSRVVMGKHGFGRGEYKYFRYPLPELIESMRTELYRGLAPLANQVE
jgi:hypothetical protein